jgi:transposase-like protein
VFALVERGGAVRTHHVPDVTGKTLRKILTAEVDAKSSVMTDDAGQYRHVGEDFARHEAVNHGDGEYVRGDAHTNSAENFFSILKRGLTGVYHGVSQQHLHRYLSEFSHRYTHRVGVGVDDVARADIALVGIKGKRLTYRRISQR